ncbi:MAG: Bacterial alpha-L-rhamnosidase [Candidatus Glassbacteria bacterium]|nr:Bacterial alpha-L-rhamnosidase [Candidatus Glassbacteria bacterium]
MLTSRIIPLVLTCLFLTADARAVCAQGPVNLVLLSEQWDASWISAPGADPKGFGVYHFRKSLRLAGRPEKFVVHVSADNRYKLYVNGVETGSGPSRGDLWHWRFETYDLAPLLGEGVNQIAAVVWNFGKHVPYAQMTWETGFLMQGDSDAESSVNTGTDSGWKVLDDKSYSPIPINTSTMGAFTVVGPGERVDGHRYPWGWLEPGFDDEGWADAVQTALACPRGIRWMRSHRHLVPRTIPPMELSSQQAPVVRRMEGAGAAAGKPLSGLVIPAGSKAKFLLDQTRLTAAYPLLALSGGRDARIRLTYAEALVDSAGHKAHRDSVDGMSLFGYYDEFIADGGEGRVFSTLWWRTFRYLELAISTGDQALVIDSLTSLYTGYPFRQQAEFVSDDRSLKEIWDVGWRTARLCAGETYFDCPYYEQLNYVGDTRIQALISLYAAGDGRLARKAIAQFDDSRLPDGLTQSRYPSYMTQVIPPYSLFWVAMVHDWWMYRGEEDYIRSLLPGIRGVIDWFASRLDRSGMNGALPWWNFADWADEYDAGVPPGADEGGSALISLQLVYAARMAAEMAEALGSPGEAERYGLLADRVGKAVLAGCWDQNRGLLAETPARRQFSQHANVMAVLTGLFPGREREIMERVLTDGRLIQCTYYYRFYLNRALKAAGMGDIYLDQLKPWYDMLDIGLTTFAEKPEPTRSDCHAWSASPLYDFLATVCGVTSDAPGFARVQIAPSLGRLREVSCKVPHPGGFITCSFKRSGKSGLSAEVELPDGVVGTFVWQGDRKPLSSGRQTLQF